MDFELRYNIIKQKWLIIKSKILSEKKFNENLYLELNYLLAHIKSAMFYFDFKFSKMTAESITFIENEYSHYMYKLFKVIYNFIKRYNINKHI